jgi:hypothetical protein
MIGVVAEYTEAAIVQEFFQLFKTPWEFYREDAQYEVVLISRNGSTVNCHARLTVIYGADSRDDGEERGASTAGCGKLLSYQGRRLPIYGECITFQEWGCDLLVYQDSGQSAVALRKTSEGLCAQVGYDLFGEVRVLLTDGQPAANAEYPTMELHIALLRKLIVDAGIWLIEIPPVPSKHSFITCLTHDVDHPSLRAHLFDHTMLGFLHRALVGSLFNLVRGRASVSDLIRNWIAAVKLPFVYLGFVRDTWDTFDKYIRIELGLGSSFFIIPFSDISGDGADGGAPRRRASRYGAADILVQMQNLMAAGCEIGLHGIDAWTDAAKGRGEVREIRRLTGSNEVGARMHWLYFDARSPSVLEEGGIDYDSTNGYNDAIGYRAGTTQVYKPPGVTRLLELPLHVMDTALFFPAHLDLDANQARKRVNRIIDNAIEFGGCVTVNWHDRSIAPERLWGDFYIELVEGLKGKGAWFPTAKQAVSWFRKRRSAVFRTSSTQAGGARLTVIVDGTQDLPDLQVRVYCDGKIYDFPVGGATSDCGGNEIMRWTIELPRFGHAELN